MADATYPPNRAYHRASDGAIVVPDGASLVIESGGTFTPLAASIAGASLAAGAVTFDKAKAFVSAEQTGTGSAQNVAHGLAATPSAVLIVPTDIAPATTGAYTATEGTHTSTNVVVTVTTSKKFKVMAWA